MKQSVFCLITGVLTYHLWDIVDSESLFFIMVSMQFCILNYILLKRANGYEKLVWELGFGLSAIGIIDELFGYPQQFQINDIMAYAALSIRLIYSLYILKRKKCEHTKYTGEH